MARTQFRILWLVAAVALPTLVAAQWGVQGSFLQYETLNKAGMMNLMFGMSHNQSERSGWALEANVGYSGISPSALFDYDNGYNSNGDRYSFRAFDYGLTYRSMYFLADNDNNATFYLGPFVGVRWINTKVERTIYNDYGYPPTYLNAEESNVIFPLGLRLGWRGGLDGFVGDLYVGLGYNAGGSEKLKFVEDRHQFRRFFLQVGYSFGAGWE